MTVNRQIQLAPAAPATVPAAGPRPTYVIVLPARLKLLNSNRPLHHRQKAERTKAIREAAFEAVSESIDLMDALAAAKPDALLQRAHILGVVHPTNNGRCDPANWYPSFKAAVDGLVNAGLVEDDDHTRVVGPDMRLGRVVKGGQIALVIRGLAPGENWPDLGTVTR